MNDTRDNFSSTADASTTLSARIGIARLEQYLAKQAAFAAYLERTGRA